MDDVTVSDKELKIFYAENKDMLGNSQFEDVKEPLYEYVLNQKSGEVHDYKNLTTNCHYDKIVDKKFLTEKKMKKLMQGSFVNGCRWCMKEYDTD